MYPYFYSTPISLSQVTMTFIYLWPSKTSQYKSLTNISSYE